MIVLANVGPLISSRYLCSDSVFYIQAIYEIKIEGGKDCLGNYFYCDVMTAVSHFPAILGLVRAYILYLVYKKWNEKDVVVVEDSDPFIVWKTMERLK